MNLDTAIRLTAQVQGANNIRSLAQQFQGLSATSQVSGRQLDRLYTETKKLAAAAGGSINALRQQRTALATLRDAVEPTSRRFQLLTRDVEALDRRLKALNGTQQQVADSQRRMVRQAAGSALGTLATGGGVQGAVGALAGGLAFSGSAAGLAAGAGLTAVAAGGALAARVGVDAETAQVRLKALTDQFGEYNQAQAAAARIAGTLRISSIEASDGFSKLYAALRPTGVTLQEIEDAFVGFTAAARVSGATATESSAALEQLKQALGSGVLQGDELRSLREQAPLAAQAIAREMGVTIGELKKLGSEGQITTDIVLRALAKLKNENLGKLNQQFNTSAQAIKDLQIASEDLGRTIARVFGPTTVALLRGFTAAVKDAADVWASLTGDRGAEGRIQDEIRAREQAQRDTNARPFAWWDNNGRRQFFEQRRQQLFQQYQQNRLNQAPGDDPTSAQSGARAGAAAEREAARRRAAEEAGKAARKEQEKAEKEAQKAAQQALERQISLQERLSDLRLRTEERVADLMEATNERALQMVQQINDEKLQGERRIKALQAETAGNYADIQLNLEILRQRASGMPTAGLETRLRLDQSRRQYDAETISIVNEAKDRDQELTRRLSDFSKGFTDSLQGIFTQGAEQYRDAMQDAARDEEKAGRRDAARGLPAGASLPTSPGGGMAFFGRTGRMSLAAGYGMVDVRGPNRNAVMQDAMDIIRANSARGVQTLIGGDMSGDIDATRLTGEQLADAVARGIARHANRVSRGTFAIDLIARVGTPVGIPLAGVSNRGGATGVAGATQRGSLALHLAPNSASGGRPMTAAAMPAPMPPPMAATSYEIPGASGITTAAGGLSDVIMGEANAKSGNSLSELLKQRLSELSDATSEIDSQTQSTTQQLENYQRQLVLVRGGLSPEIAQMRVEAERSLDIERQSLQALEQRLILDLQDKTISADTKSVMSEILKSVQGRLAAQPGIVEGLVAERVQLDELTRAYEDQKALVEGISGSIGNGLSASLDLLISGTESWGNSLREIASGVLQDIARQLAQSLVVKPVVNAISGAFGFANGGIMTSAGPLPLRAYANGGIASSPQLALFGEGRMPEAYVPLPDGRRIPVAMQGGGGSNVVNVTVNAEGSQVQGDSGQSEQLGRVVAKAIQEEMIRQRRPGGLLAAAA